MSKSDRELLELAAKAYADDTVRKSPFGFERVIGWDETLQCDVMVSWDPLENDADALQLAASLELEVSFGRCGAIIYMNGGVKIEEISDDYMPATRRAIVRAAAAIGEVMQ